MAAVRAGIGRRGRCAAGSRRRFFDGSVRSLELEHHAMNRMVDAAERGHSLRRLLADVLGRPVFFRVGQ